MWLAHVGWCHVWAKGVRQADVTHRSTNRQNSWFKQVWLFLLVLLWSGEFFHQEATGNSNKVDELETVNLTENKPLWPNNQTPCFTNWQSNSTKQRKQQMNNNQTKYVPTSLCVPGSGKHKSTTLRGCWETKKCFKLILFQIVSLPTI